MTVDGLRWRYLHAGSGSPLILVHGLLGHSFSWRYVLSNLASEREVFAVDLPGSGDSDAPADDVSLRKSSKRFLRFLDVLNISCCDLVGTSYGGAIAMTAAALAPKRVDRLVLAAPVNPWSTHGKLLAHFLSSSLIAPGFLQLAPHLGALEEFYFRRLFGDTRRIPSGSLEGYVRPLLHKGVLEHKLRLLRTWNRDLAELEVIIQQIANIPTLLLWGSDDAAVSPVSALELKKRLLDSKLIVLEGVGHLPYEETPLEFSRVIAEFLRIREGSVAGNK